MTQANHAPAADDPRQHGRFMASHALVCCLAAALIGGVAGRAAASIEHIRAPLLLFPVFVGVAIGLSLVALMRLTDIRHRPTLVAGAVVAALLAVAGQHYFPYRDYLRDRAAFLAQKHDSGLHELFHGAASGARTGFAAYMRGQAACGRPITAALTLRGPFVWASWALDGTLLLASAAAITVVFSRGPYGKQALDKDGEQPAK